MSEEVHHPHRMVLDYIRHLDHRFRPRVGRPEVPPVTVLPSPRPALVPDSDTSLILPLTSPREAIFPSARHSTVRLLRGTMQGFRSVPVASLSGGAGGEVPVDGTPPSHEATHLKPVGRH